jgi:4'-phosphopantetheinyl transferase
MEYTSQPDEHSCEVYFAHIGSLRPEHVEVLNDQELERRGRFRLPDDSYRFTAAAVLLRVVVGLKTGQDPRKVEVSRTCERCGAPHGRPRVPQTRIEASISHSGDHVVVALSTAGPVGIDVEADKSIDWEPLVPIVCTPAEEQHVAAARDLYVYWTRKEAVLKAGHCGLSIPLTEVVVTPPTSEPRIIAYCGGDAPPCQMIDVSPNDSYAGCAAVLTGTDLRFDVVEADALLAHI